ncbi:MAG: universal stress protein UspA [Kordiimonas sp.]|nr:universal stress protein UspA [Kordiimonas sp.]
MSIESGLWKFLVFIDDTPECKAAVRLAALRAAKIGGTVTMMYIIPPADFQHWVAVRDLMEHEAREAAEEILQGFSQDVEALAAIHPETVIRMGDPKKVIVEYLKEDPDIHMIVLAAAVGEDPGPLTQAFREDLLAKVHRPVVVVPGNMTEEEIDEIV